MLRTTSIILALCVTSQAVAQGGGTWVCRHAAKVLEPCACPHEPGSDDDGPGVRERSCCDLHQAADAPSAMALKVAAPAPMKQLLTEGLAPAPEQPMAGGKSTRIPAFQSQAPPSTPLYLSIRTLLI
jgi:hypothetical protein